MPSYKTKAIVLKTFKLGEADKIIKLFSQKNGPVDAIAKGSRKMKSRFGGRLELFNFLDLELSSGRNIDIITQAEIIKSFKNIPHDFNKYLFSQLISEVVLKTHLSDSEASPVVFKLLYVFFNEVDSIKSEDTCYIEKIAAFFIAKFLKIAGYSPLIKNCSMCGMNINTGNDKESELPLPGKKLFFSIELGGIVCNGCVSKTRDTGTKKRPVSAEKYLYLCRLFESGLKKFREFYIRPEVIKGTYKLLGDYIKYHTDCRVNIFSYLDKILSE
jgi:DNA repair protein RecO (recombination protein O)